MSLKTADQAIAYKQRLQEQLEVKHKRRAELITASQEISKLDSAIEALEQELKSL